jgi:hypothetical protein
MTLESQAIADARQGAGPSARDRATYIAGVVLKVVVVFTSPVGFYDLGFARESMRLLGIWLLISALPYLLTVAELYARRLMGQTGVRWVEQPAPRFRIYCAVGIALIALSSLHLGVGGAGGFRAHFPQLISVLLFVSIWAITLGIPIVIVVRKLRGSHLGLQHHAPLIVDPNVARDYDAYYAQNWGLRIGVATKDLSLRDPSNSFPAGLLVRLPLPDASRGTIMFGSMGSGKTQFLRSCAVDAARQGSGLLALSAKPGDATAIFEIARQHREALHVHMIGADFESANLLKGITPERVGACFKNLANSRESFWESNAGLLMASAAQLAWGLAGTTVRLDTKEGEPERGFDIEYDLKTIHLLVWGSSEKRIAALQSALDALPALRRADPPRADALESAYNYFSDSFEDMADSKSQLNGVKAGIIPYLLPLISGTTRRTWGDPDGLDISKTLDAGECIILAPAKAENSQIFELVAQFTVMHLTDLALRRTARSHNIPIVAILDEYGSFASIDHLALFETARESSICLTISTISVKNLAARVGAVAADAIPAAFGNILCFATGDKDTKNLISDRIGKVRLSDTSASSSTSSSSGQNGRSSESSSISRRHVEVSIVDDENCWRTLGVNQSGGYSTALCTLSENGRNRHAVVRVPPAGAQA